MLEESLCPTGSAIFAPVLRPVLASAIALSAASAHGSVAFRWRAGRGSKRRTQIKQY